MAAMLIPAAHLGGDTIPLPRRRRRRATLTHAQRERIEALIERLIVMLDASEGDLDLEPDEDCCAGYDDDPAWLACASNLPGDADDAEQDEDLEATCQPPVTPDAAPAALRWHA